MRGNTRAEECFHTLIIFLGSIEIPKVNSVWQDCCKRKMHKSFDWTLHGYRVNDHSKTPLCYRQRDTAQSKWTSGTLEQCSSSLPILVKVSSSNSINLKPLLSMQPGISVLILSIVHRSSNRPLLSLSFTWTENFSELVYSRVIVSSFSSRVFGDPTAIIASSDILTIGYEGLVRSAISYNGGIYSYAARHLYLSLPSGNAGRYPGSETLMVSRCNEGQSYSNTFR